MAAWAKKHLEVAREYKDKLPEHTHWALLLSIPAEIFLNDLETYNFDLFDEHFTQNPSYIKVPMKILKAAKKGIY